MKLLIIKHRGGGKKKKKTFSHDRNDRSMHITDEGKQCDEIRYPSSFQCDLHSSVCVLDLLKATNSRRQFLINIKERERERWKICCESEESFLLCLSISELT
jgi:Na+-translocating ferredoxin:NAD+ oxidoreductase RnfC subunit